jgi:hypothetical protein
MAEVKRRVLYPYPLDMQEVAADAARISSGGPPVVLVGSNE